MKKIRLILALILSISWISINAQNASINTVKDTVFIPFTPYKPLEKVCPKDLSGLLIHTAEQYKELLLGEGFSEKECAVFPFIDFEKHSLIGALTIYDVQSKKNKVNRRLYYTYNEEGRSYLNYEITFLLAEPHIEDKPFYNWVLVPKLDIKKSRGGAISLIKRIYTPNAFQNFNNLAEKYLAKESQKAKYLSTQDSIFIPFLKLDAYELRYYIFEGRAGGGLRRLFGPDSNSSAFHHIKTQEKWERVIGPYAHSYQMPASDLMLFFPQIDFSRFEILAVLEDWESYLTECDRMSEFIYNPQDQTLLFLLKLNWNNTEVIMQGYQGYYQFFLIPKQEITFRRGRFDTQKVNYPFKHSALRKKYNPAKLSYFYD